MLFKPLEKQKTRKERLTYSFIAARTIHFPAERAEMTRVYCRAAADVYVEKLHNCSLQNAKPLPPDAPEMEKRSNNLSASCRQTFSNYLVLKNIVVQGSNYPIPPQGARGFLSRKFLSVALLPFASERKYVTIFCLGLNRRYNKIVSRRNDEALMSCLEERSALENFQERMRQMASEPPPPPEISVKTGKTAKIHGKLTVKQKSESAP